jgi:hypothetical protein
MFAAAALAAAAFIAAAFQAASLYIDRRATPAKERGVQGIPIIASAFLTNPNLNDRSANDKKDRNTVSTISIKTVFILLLLSNLLRYEKSETRISKAAPRTETIFKIRNKAQNRNPQGSCFGHLLFWSFDIVSNFDFRASDFLQFILASPLRR